MADGIEPVPLRPSDLRVDLRREDALLLDERPREQLTVGIDYRRNSGAA